MIAVALFAAFSLSAQEPGKFRLVRPDSTRTGSFRLPDSLRVEMSVPDSLAHMSPWKTDFRTAAPMKVKPAVSMTSVVVIQKENLPSRVTVIDNNSLRLGSHFNLSNGQAWNWSPFPDAFLDARTLSFPMSLATPRNCSAASPCARIARRTGSTPNVRRVPSMCRSPAR